MKFENTEVFNFEGALRGMRNPLASWNKSDSYLDNNNNYIIGQKDMDLAMRLCAAGPEHRKFLRQIMVSVDITAPMYWWSQFDTYKINTVANSTSKMHKLASTPITFECFEINDYNLNISYAIGIESPKTSIQAMVIDFLDCLEELRQKYNETKDKRYWEELVRWLPESWLQTRTITMNYEVIHNICHQREGHKLLEWTAFINWAHSLPYAEQFIFEKRIAFN